MKPAPTVRGVLIAAALLSFDGCATKGTARDDDRATPAAVADVYARAAHLQPLQSGGPEELRIWTTGANIVGALYGDLVVASGVSHCQIAESLAGSKVVYGPANCHPLGNMPRPLLDLLPRLSHESFDSCGLDGDEVVVDGVVNAQRFTLRLGNPASCNDLFRKISQLLVPQPQ